MKFFKTYPLLILIFFISYQALNAQKLTVASFNIRYANDGDAQKGNGWNQRCPVVCELIRFHDFEIFGAQEVLNNPLNDMLKNLPGYSYIGVGRDDGDKAGEYAPIFYKTERFDLLQSGHFWMSENTDYPSKGWDAVLPRICTWGEFKDKLNGKQFWFFNLHMDHVGVEARRHSAELVLKKIKEMCGNEPVILTGDFNVDQTHKSYEILSTSGILEDSYQTANVRYALNGTFNNFNASLKTDSRIDHVFVSPTFTVERYGVLTDSYRMAVENSDQEIKSGNFPKEVSLHQYIIRLPSDHFPVMVELTYK